MGKHCEVCGKAPVIGNQVTIRGKAKYLGGVGTKVTGISRAAVQAELAARAYHDSQGHQHHDPRLHAVHPLGRRHQARPQRPLQAAGRRGQELSTGRFGAKAAANPVAASTAAGGQADVAS